MLIIYLCIILLVIIQACRSESQESMSNISRDELARNYLSNEGYASVIPMSSRTETTGSYIAVKSDGTQHRIDLRFNGDMVSKYSNELRSKIHSSMDTLRSKFNVL